MPGRIFLTFLLLILFVGCSDKSDDKKEESNDNLGSVEIPDEDSQKDSDFPESLLSQKVQWQNCFLDDNKEEGDAQCALIEVPLYWNNSDGDRIKIHVKRTPPSGNSKRQFFMLDGGPGGAGTTDYPRYMELMHEADPETDFYTLDHRGTGLSNRLGCPEQEEKGSEWGVFLSDTEWLTCIDYIKESDMHLDAYTPTEAARDVAFLLALVEKENTRQFVYGSSYGTYLAIRYAHLYPDQPDGIVIDSICPPGTCRLDRQDKLADDVVADLFSLCKEDPFCRSKMGDNPLETATGALNSFKNGGCSELSGKRIIPGHIQQLAYTLGTRWHLRPLIPAVFYRLGRCEEGDVAAIYSLMLTLMQTDIYNPPVYYTRFSHVLNRSIVYAELMGDELPDVASLEVIDASLLASSHNSVRVATLMEMWPVYDRDEFFGKWPATDLPVLMLNGTLDVQTPLSIAEEAKSRLSGENQKFIEIPFGAHGVIGQSPVSKKGDLPCGMRIVLDYIKTGEVVTSCLDNLLAVDFHGFPEHFEPVLGTDDMWENADNSTADDDSPSKSDEDERTDEDNQTDVEVLSDED